MYSDSYHCILITRYYIYVSNLPIIYDRLQPSTHILKLRGEEVGKDKERKREGHGTKMVAALWQEISANNTSSKYTGCYIRSWHSHSNISDKCF
jgi:hypothetical protein